jgi:hypothetical protein
MAEFSVEEITVINNYHRADRVECINILTETLPYYKRPDFEDVGELVESVLYKLNQITDEQYSNIDLSLSFELDW